VYKQRKRPLRLNPDPIGHETPERAIRLRKEVCKPFRNLHLGCPNSHRVIFKTLTEYWMIWSEVLVLETGELVSEP
jgi:hypothetical protein